MLGLVSPEDPEPIVSVQSPLSEPPENHGQAQGITPSPPLVPNPAPPVLNSPNPPAQSSNDMQIDQTSVLPVTALPQDQTPVGDTPPVLNPAPSTIKFSEGVPPVPEPPAPSPWNTIGFVGDEDEGEDEEVPSINMDSDSD